jgi:hypothetical protein
MPKPVGTGVLFAKDVHGDFMRLTGSRYNAMMTRLAKKKLIDKDHPPFTCDQYRAAILKAMNGKEDGFIKCRYCLGYFGIVDIASDHAQPLHRHGSVGLDNLEFPCKPCNSRKGKMTPDEYIKLLNFLELEIPMARMEVLNRLEISVQLVTSIRSQAPVIKELKDSGDWERAQRIRKQRKRDKEAGLGAF